MVHHYKTFSVIEDLIGRGFIISYYSSLKAYLIYIAFGACKEVRRKFESVGRN